MDEDAQNASLSSDPVELSQFERVKTRLEEIANVVDSDELTLDQALDLYEEAVALGLQATDLLDVDITVQEGIDAAAEQDLSEGDVMQISQEGLSDTDVVEDH